MEGVNTNIDLGGSNQTNVNTSSSITYGNNTGAASTNTSTSSFQTPNNNTNASIDEVDLSREVQPDNRNFLQKAGDWLVDTGKSIYDTGANIVEDVKSWAIGALKGAGATLAETAANLASDVSTITSKLGSAFIDGYKALKSTEAVIATSVVSGVAKLGEHLVDALAWCGGKLIEGRAYVDGAIVGLFNEEAGEAIKNAGKQTNKKIKEWIAVDAVGEANKWFYENTDLGQWINENSMIKYDSEAAKKIQGVTEKAAELAAATALTVFTGGAATFAVGALYGIGKQAESTYQNHGTDTTLLQEAGIVGAGALTGLSWMANGKLGAGFLEIGKTAAEVGVKEVVSQLSKDVISKDFWMKALKEGLTGANGVGNYIGSAMMTGEDILPYLNGEKEWDSKALGTIALSYLKNLGLNVAEDALRGYVGDFSSAKAIEAISGSKIDDEMSEADLGKIMGGTPIGSKGDLGSDASKIDNEMSESELEGILGGQPQVAAGEVLTNNRIDLDHWDFFQFRSAVGNAPFTAEIDGITFRSNTRTGLNGLIEYYNSVIAARRVDGGYFTDLLRTKNVIITDIAENNSFQVSNYINFSSTAIKNRDLGTFFHECGHYLDADSAFREKGAFDAVIRDLQDPTKYDLNSGLRRFKADVDNLKRNVEQMVSERKPYLYREAMDEMARTYQDWDKVLPDMQRRLIDDLYYQKVSDYRDSLNRNSGLSSISDIFDALTSGKAQGFLGFYGHGEKYYQRDGMAKYLETLANISALYNSGQMGLLDRYFPPSVRKAFTESYERLIQVDQLRQAMAKYAFFQDTKYTSGSFVNGLLDYLVHHNPNVLTRDHGIRDLVTSMPDSSIAKFLSLDEVFMTKLANFNEGIDKAYGQGYFKRCLESYLNGTNGINVFTRQGNLRTFMGLLTGSQIQSYLNELRRLGF